MNKKIKLKILSLLSVIILIVILSFIRINLFQISNGELLLEQPFAHRGLYNSDVPENSLRAFENAINNSFAIELDVMLTKDNVPIVFHDDNTLRMTGISKEIKKTNWNDLKCLKLNGTDETIPTLEEALLFIAAKTTILIEIKNSMLPGLLESKVKEILDKYSGDIIIQSYNPITCKWFKVNSKYLVGLILGDSVTDLTRILRDNIYTFVSRPNFMNYKYELLIHDSTIEKLRVKGVYVLAYTIDISQIEETEKKLFDNAIISIEE